MDGTRLSFHIFPKDEDSRRLWVSRVNRADLTLKNVTRHTVLCSLHFHNGKRTAQQPYPVTFSHGTYPLSRARPMSRPLPEHSPPIKRRPSTTEDVFQPLMLATLAHRAVQRRVRTQEKRICNLTAEIRYLHSEPTLLSWDLLATKPDKLKFYTGLPSIGTFTKILLHLHSEIQGLHVRAVRKEVPSTPGNVTPPPATLRQKQGRPRTLPPADEFLLVLVWLRHAFKQEVLADMFRLSSASQVSYLINTWVPFLATELGGLLKWPSREEVRANLPIAFQDDLECRSVRVILDCYEVWVEAPSSLSLNAAMYSDYKGRTTFKVLVGVTPTGYVSFVSNAYPGSISDPEITRQSGILDKMEAGDRLMVDKGFTLAAEDLQPRGLKLAMPPFREGDKPMPASAVVRNRKIANKRIVVENSIGRMRDWDILQNRLCLRAAQSGHVSDVVKLVAIFANCGPALRK